MGIGNDKARIHIELNKDPKTIEEAVQEVITFMETTIYPQHDDEQYFNKRRFVRQVTRTEKDTSDWKTGKLNGKRPLTTQKEQKADYGLFFILSLLLVHLFKHLLYLLHINTLVACTCTIICFLFLLCCQRSFKRHTQIEMPELDKRTFYKDF
jgi:Flp pilus assembly protein TadB